MRNLKFPLTYIIMQKVEFTARGIIDRIYWSSWRVILQYHLGKRRLATILSTHSHSDWLQKCVCILPPSNSYFLFCNMSMWQFWQQHNIHPCTKRDGIHRRYSDRSPHISNLSPPWEVTFLVGDYSWLAQNWNPPWEVSFSELGAGILGLPRIGYSVWFWQQNLYTGPGYSIYVCID